MSEFEGSQFGISGSSLGELRREPITPEKNLLESRALQALFSHISRITRSSFIPGTESQRPLSLRAKRSELYKKAKEARSKGLKEEAKLIFQEGRFRDEIAKQYLNQGEVKVVFNNLGEQRARFNIVKPPESLDKHLPPIYLIPGISNDIDCVGWLIQELAFQGREVITVAFPESFMGTVTEEFVRSVEQSQIYEPHTEFFKRALQELIPSGRDFELWGFSTGSPIVSEILQDEALQGQVARAVLLCPASSIDVSSLSLKSGITQDIVYLLHHIGYAPKYTFSRGRKDSIDQEDAGQRQLKERVFNALLGKVRKKHDLWQKARVKNSGEIIVVSGELDNITKSRKIFNDEEQLKRINPQIRLFNIPKGRHMSPLIYPEAILPGIFAKANYTPML